MLTVLKDNMQPGVSGENSFDPADPANAGVLHDQIITTATSGCRLHLIIGTCLERRHFASIRRREAAFAHYPAAPTKSVDEGREVAEARLVTASTVVSLDYCKRFLAKLRNIFGGRIRSYESRWEASKCSRPGPCAILNDPGAGR